MTPTERALALCDHIATRTDVPGQIHRLFLSPATHTLHTYLRAQMQAAGLTVRTDAIGNLRGTLPSCTPQAKTLLIGSHIDTVPNAGRYDGILGVALPLALIPTLPSLPYNLELIAFSEEEGVRFRTPFLGSRALTNTLPSLSLADPDGITIQQALTTLTPDIPATLTPGTFAFLEVHIEQGPVLESLDIPLGIVTSIVGQTRLTLTFTGQANHAGTTPMPLRRDALTAAAVFITHVETTAQATSDLVATVGVIEAQPGAPNIIPGQVTLSLDIRHPDDCTRLRTRRALTTRARAIATERKLEVRIRQTSQQATIAMHPALTAALATAAQATNNPTHTMHSGAGHDAMILAEHLPTTMLFLRSPAGLSHHPDEAVLAEDITAACETLTHFLTHLDPATLE